MYKFMKRVPAGLLLVPMLISALIHTFAPNLFSNLGGVSEALFTTKGINYVIGATCFCSGAGIDMQRLKKVLKKQGVLLLIKTILCIMAGYSFIKIFGLEGIWGISAIAFITAICSTNPSLYLALEQDYGTEDDVGAFGLVGLFCVPAYPMLIFSISQATPIDWTPIISTIVPIIFGMVLGNLDKDLANFFKPGIIVLTPFMGWAFGAGINLIDAVQAGPQGIVLSLLYYIFMIPVMFLYERRFMHTDGIATLSMASIAGMSVSVPALLAASNEIYAPFVAEATAQIAFGVVITSIVTPILASKFYAYDHRHIYNKII